MEPNLELREKAQPMHLEKFNGKHEEEERQSPSGKRARTARLQIILPEPSYDRLEAIKEETEAASFAEVFRRALRLYEGLLAETEGGGKLVVLRADGSTVDVPISRAL